MSVGGGANLGSAYGVVIIDTSQALASLAALEGALAGMGARSTAATTKASAAASAAGQAATVAGVGAAIFLGAAIKQAATFEFRMSALQSVLGATDQQMQGLSRTILQIGAESSFTNEEVALTAQNLAQLGISMENLMGGALEAVTALSAATETAPDVAANVLGAAMNQYQIAGGDIMRIADLFTRASNQSAATVTSLGEGFVYAAGTASALGVPIEDLIVALELLNDRGLKGTMAGTTLNQALLSLTAPTDQAATAMEALGIDMFDAEGKFVGIREAVLQLDKAFEGLTDEQMMEHLNDIFTVRGARAIFELLKAEEEETIAAGKGWESYRLGLESGSTASQQAGERLDNLLGSLEKLKGAFDSLLTVIGTPLLGGLKALVDAVTFLVTAFSNLPSSVLGAFTALLVPLSIFGTLSAVARIAGISFLRLIPGMTAVGAAAGALAAPLAIAAAAIGLFIAAYKTNFLGLGDAIDDVIKKIEQVIALLKTPIDFFGLKGKKNKLGEKLAEELGINDLFDRHLRKSLEQQLADLIPDSIPTKGDIFDDWFESNFDDKGRQLGDLEMSFRRIGNVIDLVFGTGLSDIFQSFGRGLDRFPASFGKMKNQLEDIAAVFKDQGFIKGFQSIFGKNGQELIEGFGDALAGVPKLVGGVLQSIKTGIKPLDKILTNTGKVFTTLGRAIQELFQGDIAGFQDVMDRLSDQVTKLAESILDGLIEAIENIPWGEVWDAVVTGLIGAASILGTIAGGILGIIAGVASAIWGSIYDALVGAGGAESGIDWGGVWTTVKDAIVAAAPEVLDLGITIAMSFLAALDKQVFGPDGFRGWLEDQLGILPMGDLAGQNNKGSGLPMGDLLLMFTAKLLGDIWGGLGTFAAWLMDQLGEGFQFAVDEAIPATLKFAAELAGSIWGEGVSAAQWLYSKTIAGGTIAVQEVIPATLKFLAQLLGTIWGGFSGAGAWLYGNAIAGGTIAVDTVIPATLHFLAQLAGSIWGGLSSAGQWLYNNTIAGGTIDVAEVINASLHFLAQLAGSIWGGFETAGGWLYSKIAKVIDVPGLKANLDIAVDKITGGVEEFNQNPSAAVGKALDWAEGTAKDIVVGAINLVTSGVTITTNAVSTEGGGGGGGGIGQSIVDSISDSLADIKNIDFAGIGTALKDLLISALTFRADLPEAQEVGQQIGAAVGNMIAAALEFVFSGDTWKVAAGGLAAGAIGVPAAIGNLGRQLMLLLVAGMTGFAEGLIVGDEMKAGVAGDVQMIVQAISDIIINALENIQEITNLGVIADTFSGLGKAVVGLIGEGLSSLADLDDLDLSDLGGKIIGVVTRALTELFSGPGSMDTAGAGTGARNLTTGIMTSMLRDMGTDTPDAGAGEGVGLALGNALLTAIGSGLQQAVDAGGEVFAGAVEAIKGTLGKLLEAAIDNLPIPEWGKDFLRDQLGLDKGDGDGVYKENEIILAEQIAAQIRLMKAAKEKVDNELNQQLAAGENPIPPAEPAPTADENAEYMLRSLGFGKNFPDSLKRGLEPILKGTGFALDNARKELGTKVTGFSRDIANSLRDDIGPALKGLGDLKLPSMKVGPTDVSGAHLAAPAPVKVPPADLTAYQASIQAIPRMLAVAFAQTIMVATAGAAFIGVVIGTGIGTMVGNVSALMTGFTNAIGTGMSGGLAVAFIYANAIYVVVSTQIGMLVGNVAALMTGFTNAVGQGMSNALAVAAIYASAIVTVISGIAANAFSSGAAIGQGLADGMNSTKGLVEAAAAGLAAAAAAATAAALKEASPSKVFIKKGINIGRGLALGMDRTREVVERAATQMARSSFFADPQQSVGLASVSRGGGASSPIIGGGSSVITHTNNIALDVDMSRVRQVNEVIDFVTGLNRGVDLVTTTTRGVK